MDSYTKCTRCKHELFWHKERCNNGKPDSCTKNSCVCKKFSQSKKVKSGRLCNCPCHNSNRVNLCGGCVENQCYLYLEHTERIYSYNNKKYKTVEGEKP